METLMSFGRFSTFKNSIFGRYNSRKDIVRIKSNGTKIQCRVNVRCHCIFLCRAPKNLLNFFEQTKLEDETLGPEKYRKRTLIKRMKETKAIVKSSTWNRKCSFSIDLHKMEFQLRVIETNEQLWSAQVIQKFIRLDGIVSGIYYFEPAPIGHAKVAWQHWKINTRYYVSCTRIMYVVLTANSHRVVLLADYEVTSVFSSWRSAPATVPGLLQFPVRTTQCIQRRETTLCGTRGTRGNCIYSGAPRNCTYVCCGQLL